MRASHLRSAVAAIAALVATPARADCAVDKVAELPVTMAGSRPLIPARINGQEVRFIADSGAFFSLIGPDTAAALKLPHSPTGLRMSGIGGTVSIDVATVKTFTLAGVDIHNVEFTVGGSSTGVAGLIGQNVLGFADVEYDLANGVIRLFKPHGCTKVAMAYWTGGKPYSMLPISAPDPRNRHTRGTVTVNGVKLTAIFDTGAESTVLDVAAAARAGIRPGDPGVEAEGITRGIGRDVAQQWRAKVASVKIGDNEEIRNGWLRIGKFDLPDVDMLIGADFFLSHRVYVANGQRRLYFSYNGGPAFGIPSDHTSAAPHDDGADHPTDADGFARRGAARSARGDVAGALADLDEAVARAPDSVAILLIRARILAEAQRAMAARADIDKAIVLDPRHAEARLLRARLEYRGGDATAALADVDAAADAVAGPDDVRLEIAGLYDRGDAFDRAIVQYGLWIAAHREDSRLPNALNGRCWSRALAGKELDLALEDCNVALRRRPGTAQFLDSRGLVYWRRNQPDKALADYAAALKVQPRMAWSLFGRSILKAKSDPAASHADLAAAVAIDPELPARARRYGIAP